jgi:hypothetical protein
MRYTSAATQELPVERITFSLPAPQVSWLADEAKRIGITIGELLRRIIDQAKDSR